MARRNQVSEGGSIIAVQVENEVRLDRSRPTTSGHSWAED